MSFFYPHAQVFSTRLACYFVKIWVERCSGLGIFMPQQGREGGGKYNGGVGATDIDFL